MRTPFINKSRFVRSGIAMMVVLCAGMFPITGYGYVMSDDVQVNQQVGDVVPPPPPVIPPGGGIPLPPLTIDNVTVTTDSGSAVVSWTTSYPSIAVVRWGEGDAYGKGSIAETSFSGVHMVTIDGLDPGTQYVLSVSARSETGMTAVKEGVLFRTKRLPDTTPPANVANFTAVWHEPAVTLSWNNPADADFARVRVVRSDLFFPTDPYDGLVIYEGKKESIDDSWVTPGTTYYYAAFAQDASGNYASGAIAKIRIPVPAETPGEETPEGGDDVFGTPETPQGGGGEDLGGLTFDDFRFLQFGTDAQRTGNIMTLNSDGNWEISLPYDKVPEVLKTIGITLTDPDDPSKTFPFLLRVNADKTAYVATLAPLSRPGIYHISATVLDYKHKAIERFDGRIVIPGEIVPEDTGWQGICTYCSTGMTGLKFLHCYGWIALLLILILLLWGERKKKKR